MAKCNPVQRFTDQKSARKIMGINYLGIEEVTKHFSFNFSEKQLTKLNRIPFSKHMLCKFSGTHILFAGYPLCIKEIYQKFQHLFRIKKEKWREFSDFAEDEKVHLGWYLIAKDFKKAYISKAYELWLHKLFKYDEAHGSFYAEMERDEEKERVLYNEVYTDFEGSKGYNTYTEYIHYCPLACTAVYAIILYNLVTGMRLLEKKKYTPTMNTLGAGCHKIFVGGFNEKGLNLITRAG